MSKLKKILRSRKTTFILFGLAIALLIGTAVGGAYAALTYFSGEYIAEMQMYDIGVTLNENGNPISWRNFDGADKGTWTEQVGTLLVNTVPEGETFNVGVAYPEALSITNSGTIDAYVRVRLDKYWVDAEGKKLDDLSPALIQVKLANSSSWILDADESSDERTVLYYNQILPVGATTPAFTEQLLVNGALATKVTQTETKKDGKTVITTVYDYDGVSLYLEAWVDAVQTHNAEDAIQSAWGRKVSVSGGTLRLN